MPTYGYQCTSCTHEFSVFQSMKDDAITDCPECAGRVKRLLYPVGIVFKGSGWYVNDSRKPDNSESAAPAALEAKEGDSKSSDVKSETKADGNVETKSETKAEPKQEKKSEPTPASAAKS